MLFSVSTNPCDNLPQTVTLNYERILHNWASGFIKCIYDNCVVWTFKIQRVSVVPKPTFSRSDLIGWCIALFECSAEVQANKIGFI